MSFLKAKGKHLSPFMSFAGLVLPANRCCLLCCSIYLFFAVVISSGNAYAWNALKPIVQTDEEGIVMEEVRIPEDRVPIGINEVPDAVGVFGYPDEKIGLAITPEQAGIDTSCWSGEEYFNYQMSYVGMETFPLKDYGADFQFELIDTSGRKRTKKLYQFRKPFYGHHGIRYKNMVYMFYPPHVKGSSMLVIKHSKPMLADEQWVYDSTLRRVRRMSADQKMDSYLGTDMTNDHLDRANGQWKPRIIGEIELDVDKPPLRGRFGVDRHYNYLNGKRAVIVECFPKNRNWPVSKEIIYFDKTTGYWYYEETYDKTGRLKKTFLPFMAHLYPLEPKYFTFGDWYAHDLSTNHKTIMYYPETDKAGYKVLDYKSRDWSNYIFWYDSGYSDEYLSKRFMLRGVR